MALGRNTKTREVNSSSVFMSAINVISSAVSFNQGDLLVFTSNLLALPAAESDGATFLGAAVVSIASGKLVNPYTGIPDADTSMAASDISGPVYGSVFKCTLKTGSSLLSGGAVYLDPATTATDGIKNGVQPTGTKQIGVYVGPAVSGSAAGLQIEVLLGTRFPGDALKL